MKRLVLAFALLLAIALESKAQGPASPKTQLRSLASSPTSRSGREARRAASRGGLVSPEPALRPNRPHRLIEQNRIARAAGFVTIDNDTMLVDLHERGVLVEVSESGRGYYLDLGLSHALAVPGVGEVITELGAIYAESFPGRKLKIPSVTRTLPQHLRLQKRVPSAASCITPEQCSPHLYGLAFDISKRPMSREAIRWMRRILVAFQEQGRISTWEEMYGNNFHIMVVPSFALTKASQ